jgi:methionine biosynthesis protein MetW
VTSNGLLTDNRTRGFTAVEMTDDRYAGFNPDELESHGMAHRFIPRGSRVLDVGCGTGEFACALRNSLNCDLLGIEPHEGRAARARQYNLRVITGFVTHEVLAAEKPFDVLTFMDVLEHVPDPVELLTTASASLKGGGLIVVSVPNVAHWTVRLKLLVGRFDYQSSGIMDATHLRWFTRKTIADVLRAAGLRIQHQDVSRGEWLPVYRERFPWSWLAVHQRRKVVNWLCRWNPSLFGCQHFLVAVKDQPQKALAV